MLNIFNYQANKYSSSRNTESLFHVELAAKGDSQRKTIESFIKQGYQKSYQADITYFSPTLIALGNGSHLTAMGINSAKNKLFVEQYLMTPVEEVPYFYQQNIARKNIAEIGNLYGNNRSLTTPLFMVVGVILYLNNYSHIVVSATKPLIRILKKLGIDCQFITNAKQTKHSRNNENWGSYYQTQPQVIALSLIQIMHLIDKTPKYQRLFEELQNDIAQILPKIGCQL